MEGVSVRKCLTLQNFPKLPLWIIEYVWAHKMTDVQEAVDPSSWPEVDSQPLSLEDSWRLRVASAQVFSIVKNRHMEHFERVMGFLEATYRLLPRLVAPIKHMKIMFGLKTMAIMWMLREGRGMVDTVFKINQFFPSKLPQYQDHCNQREMFLMRKNHLDFKALAQALATDKDRLEGYMMNQMEEQYGEHYAQKVEDRLLQYLHELETVLPGDTYIDKILKKKSPVTEEEKLLLEVIASDSTTIATILEKLLHCDAKTPLKFQPEVFRGGEEADQDVSKDGPLLLDSDNDSDVPRRQQTEEDCEVVKRLEEESSDKEKEEISQRSSDCVQEATYSSQFCFKHQRWVKSILQECPDEYSEELLLQANVSLSPPLFHSSSSITSSQDLTPSDLIPCPTDQQSPSPETSTILQTAAQACEQANSEDKLSSGSPKFASDTSQRETLLQPCSSRDSLVPALLSPVVRLIDIASVRGIYLTCKPHQASLNHFTISCNKQAASASSPQTLIAPLHHTSGNDAIPQRMTKNSTLDRPETVVPTNPPNPTYQVQIAPVLKDASTFTSCQPPTKQSFSRTSRRFRRACITTTHSQALHGFIQNPSAEQFKMAPTTFQTSCLPLPDDFSVSGPLTRDASTSISQSKTLFSVCTVNQIPLSTESSQQVVPQSFIKPHVWTHISPFQAETLPCSTVISSTANSNCTAVRSETNRVRRPQLRLSVPSQAVLLKSKLLQPYVNLTRLSTQKCYQVTKGRSSTRYVEPAAQGSNDDNETDRRKEDDADSFDPNILYSSHSSSGESEDSLNRDPDYKPCIKKKRLLLEYEAARSLIHI